MNKKYDEKYLSTLQDLMNSTKSKSYEMHNLSKNDKVLDIGCGIGKDTINLSKTVYQVFGLDNDRNFIEYAKNNSESFENVNFIVGNANNLPFEDEYFSAIRVDRVFQHIKNPQPIFNEINRVLSPGGKLLIIDTDYSSLNLFMKSFEIERKIISSTMKRINNPSFTRKIGDYLNSVNLEIHELKISNLIINDFELANKIIWFKKHADLALSEGSITEEEYKEWQNFIDFSKNNYFNLSTNFFLYLIVKE